MPHALDKWMYEGGRPSRLARTLNGLWGRLAAAGIAPARLNTLEVRGRKSGRTVFSDLAAFERIAPDYPVFRVSAQLDRSR